MKYCFACGTVTSGKPFYCSSCGRSYDVKLCRRKHVNPRFAEVCSQCGSRDLSTTQPKVPLHWKVLAFILWLLLSILLGLTAIAIALDILRTPIGRGFPLLLVIVLAMVVALWFMLPDWFRRFIHWLLKRRNRLDEE